MKELNFKKLIRLAFLPAGCLALLSACATYEHDQVVRSRSAAATTVVMPTPATLFDRLDVNRDGFLSRSELAPLGVSYSGAAAPIESASAAFHRLDANGDGFLSRGEAGTTFAVIPGGSFDAFDTNRDGFLSLTEATPHLRWLHGRSAPAIMSFDALDVDRDGLLTRAEADPLLRSTRMVGGRYVVAPLASFDRLDIDRDGFLTRAEAAAAVGPAAFDQHDTNRDGFLSRAEAGILFGSSVGGTEGSYGGTVYGPR